MRERLGSWRRHRLGLACRLTGACRTESEWLASWTNETVEPDKVPLGARVWLPREGRCGRVVVRVLDGLLYRVRLDGEPGRLREYPACELEPLD
jgi:hypothetical protein